jgi:hypothetical protein
MRLSVAQRAFAGRTLALVFTAALALVCLSRYVPVPEQPVAVTLEPARVAPGESWPVVITGRRDAADFLALEFLPGDRAQFLYDSWGREGVRSESFPLLAGQRLAVRVMLPSFRQVETDPDPRGDRLRLEVDGRVLLDRAVPFHPRGSRSIFWGWNEVGGISCSLRFEGRIVHAHGGDLVGWQGWPLAFGDRLAGWVWHRPWQVVLLALLGWAAFRWGGRLAVWSSSDWQRAREGAREFAREHAVFFGAAGVSSLAFAWMITAGRFDLREPPNILCDFYDYQVASLLSGRWDVPNAGIGGEAFVVGERLYGYFGAAPGLGRLPFVVFEVAFGLLSRTSMILAFFAAQVAAYGLLRQATRVIGEAGAKPSTWTVLLFTLATGWGGALFFLSSRSYVYHEAILYGVMFALFSVGWTWRWWFAPAGRAWVGALMLGVLSLHSRPTTGLFALCFLGAVAAWRLGEGWLKHRAGQAPAGDYVRPLLIGLACVAGLFTLNLQAYAKFRTFDAAPLAISRPYNKERLAAIDGKSMHWVNIPFNVDTYFVRPNFRIEAPFPWLYLDSRAPRREYPRAKMDLPDSTLAIPYSMPALVLLALLGSGWITVRVARMRVLVGATWAATLAMSVILLTAIATAQRYTADFLPALVALAVGGAALLDRTLTGRSRWLWLAPFGVAVFWSVLLMSAFALHYQRAVVWGVPQDLRLEYQRWQERFTGNLGGLDPALLQGPGANKR